MPGLTQQETEMPLALQAVSDVDKALAISRALGTCTGEQFDVRILHMDYTGRLGHRGPFRRFAQIRFALYLAKGHEEPDDQIQSLQAIDDVSIAAEIAASIGKMTGEKYQVFVASKSFRPIKKDREIANITIQLALVPDAD